MAWTSPMTAIAGTFLTAADWNTFIRDDMNETLPGKATTAGSWFVTTGPYSIAERKNAEDTVNTVASTDSSSYTDLPGSNGPSVTLETGDLAWVFWYSRMDSNTAGSSVFVSFAVDGESSIEPIDARALLLQSGDPAQQVQYGCSTMIFVTPGVNTFTLKYRAGSGIATYARRRMFVLSL